MRGQQRDGIADILIACVDGLKGLPQAIDRRFDPPPLPGRRRLINAITERFSEELACMIVCACCPVVADGCPGALAEVTASLLLRLPDESLAEPGVYLWSVKRPSQR